MRAGNDSPQIPPPTGAPAIVVPMGFTNGSTHAPLPTSLHVRPHVLGRQSGVMPVCAASVAFQTEQPRFCCVRVSMLYFCSERGGVVVKWRSESSHAAMPYDVHLIGLLAFIQDKKAVCQWGLLSCSMGNCLASCSQNISVASCTHPADSSVDDMGCSLCVQIVARPFDEARMFRIAYAYEQQTRLRR